jgi:hypothetical protein
MRAAGRGGPAAWSVPALESKIWRRRRRHPYPAGMSAWCARATATSLFVLLAAGCASSDVSRAVGARCERAAECDERCLPPSADSPGGFCTVACDGDADCPGDSRCVDQDEGICLITCDGDAGCAFLGAGWSCKARDAHPSGGQVMVCRGD